MDECSSNQANLHDRIPTWIIKNIEDVSKISQRIYFQYILYCSYCILTVLTTSDKQVVLNEMAKLPLINLDVPFNIFFILSPLIVIFMFIYLQLYLQRQKGMIMLIRANSKRPQKRRLYPWILNIAEDPEPGPIGTLQGIFANLTLWWVLPLTLSVYPIWYLKKHDPIMSYIIGIFPVAGFALMLFFKNRYFYFLPRTGLMKMATALVGTIFILLGLVFFSIIIPGVLRGDLNNIDLSYMEISSETSANNQAAYWLDINRIHLEGANLTSTVIKHANVQAAFLERAVFTDANLEGSNFSNSNLNGAVLRGADLRGTRFIGSNLDSAEIQSSNLRNSDLSYASLRSAYFWRADLTDASLYGADLENANLQDAILINANLERVLNLTVYQLSRAKSLYRAKLDIEIKERVEKAFPELFRNPDQTSMTIKKELMTTR
jgi:uncharacterized protein YjbI with pentapeptide repeats